MNVNKQYLKWLEAVNENRRLRIRLIKEEMRKNNIHSERLQDIEADLINAPMVECRHAGFKRQC